MSSKRYDRIASELEIVRKKHGGRLSKRAVWKWAKANPRSQLHAEFDWNVQRAAEKHWDARSLELIKYVTVEVVNKSRRIKSVMYVRNPKAKSRESEFIAVTQQGLKIEDARQIMLNEVERCSNSIERARGVTGILAIKYPTLESELEMMLERLVVIRTALAA